MKTQLTVLALAATTIATLAACSSGGDSSSEHRVVAANANPVATKSVSSNQPSHSAKPSHKAKPKKKSAKVVSFKLVQKPKCPEGTAVFRAPAVPAIIKWKITGATGAALSVDDPTGTPGTYGPVELSGTETFMFQCNGPVGSVEKHTYAIYTVGGGKQRSMTITATAKVLDNGKP
ncbi:hypothetical protein KOI35_20600 [Actinoplanes bogorensis]|uniref:Lipoprotein n=1 Tax=Paractinoplanes bogorensis TaxID=1610840 RepID=A0ABS5YR37_9ACTN|nr:hypothetical protein [Actinoplanes bogorensis]MBU2665915.1 hypothetical protein [Actinoplanes bogorensis]